MSTIFVSPGLCAEPLIALNGWDDAGDRQALTGQTGKPNARSSRPGCIRATSRRCGLLATENDEHVCAVWARSLRVYVRAEKKEMGQNKIVNSSIISELF